MTKFETLRRDASWLIDREFAGKEIVNIDAMKMANFIFSIKNIN